MLYPIFRVTNVPLNRHWFVSYTVLIYSTKPLHVSTNLPYLSKIKFQVNWPFGSGEEAKKDFQDGCHGGQLGFPIRTILAILIYKSPRYFQPSFKSIGLLFQENKRKIDFQDGGHFGFSILATFDIQAIPMLPTKFQVNWPFGSGEEEKNRLQGDHFVFPIGTSLPIFDLQVTPMLAIKFRVNGPRGVGGVGF